MTPAQTALEHLLAAHKALKPYDAVGTYVVRGRIWDAIVSLAHQYHLPRPATSTEADHWNVLEGTIQ